MGFAKEFLKNSLGIKMIDTYWQMVLSGGGGGGGDKPWEEMTWDDVIAATKNGKYKNFEIGAMKELDLGSEGIVHMQIVGIDVDDLADGSGKAPLTFISKELLNTSHRMNPVLSPSDAPYDEGTGAIGGWGQCEMRTYLKTTVKPLIPEAVRSAIKSVTKYSNIYDISGTKVLNSTIIDDVWIPSALEVNGITSSETSGPQYTELYDSASNRKKSKQGTSASYGWALRTASNVKNFRRITTTGTTESTAADSTRYIALGFCL